MFFTRSVLAVVYLALAVVAFAAPWMPRVFWTMVMPIVPMAVVLIGFHAARRLCPIATLAAVGTRIGGRARVPRFLARAPLAVPFVILLVALVGRLVATNGDGVALGTMLLAIVATAAAVNALFGGKTWCNYVCPVGVVERIYTDAGGLRRSASNSRCAPCTGCKRACPDIDQDRSYQTSLASVDRRIAFYAFPGLVLGFYAYYRLREGEWAAFFDGRWTTHRADAALLLGPGFEMWPEVPAVVAAPLTLILFSAASFVLFALGERLVGRIVRDRALLRHRTLAVAAFVAWNVFYVFAGQPSLALVPGAQRVVALIVPVVGTLVLVRRWSRARAARRTLPVLRPSAG